ncbi:hypothetical protein FOIG_01570 [Fusarium odoratissimum NRRL 54006]|uniref:Uncharacterized protein n=2 Tax=Fusarium oxysporum species complex TaxID=171631 RepID=X0LUL1_FUSO5|nr:uncharacterized protein FOIG_01570 [Fusarium odoratissimum NRRL 54006]EXM12215.1 hypothetical protein FOIG_01570 [Fusarium odoratissimum NRRL 54006]TXC04264.1 hypothetical protein FocTR4_00000583 [Fusarium oxysporum f. sp. cubense]
MFDEQLVLTRSSWSHYKGPYPLITLRIITTCSYGGCFWVGTHNNLQDIGEPRDDVTEVSRQPEGISRPYHCTWIRSTYMLQVEAGCWNSNPHIDIEVEREG